NYMEYNNFAKPAAIAPDSILVQNYLVNNQTYFNNNKYLLDKTPRFVEKMSELFGIYPFYKEKYGHSQANIGGGMEHATMTTIKVFEEHLVAHELGHQWFGDNVTCATWNDIWLNESFATYSQLLMQEKLPALFPTTFNKTLQDLQDQVMSQPGGSVYVPVNDSYNEGRIFNYRLSYAKGATAIHNLRFEMQSDTLFFNTLKKYQQQFKDSFATTADFKQLAGQVSGKNLTDFFNQKIYGQGFPTYNVTYLKHGSDTLVLNVRQTTSVPSVTPLFSGLVEYKILSPQGDTTVKFNLSSNDQSFAMYYPKTPGGVIVDPDNWILDKAGTVVEGVSTFPDKVRIYPNPVTNRFAISMPPSLYNAARIIDVNGRILARYTIPPGATLFSQNLHVPTGVYFLHLTGSKQNTVHKILVNN
ncbi:MAG TPA: M1 family aminopeptidase, partial [Segetibacter sp.]